MGKANKFAGGNGGKIGKVAYGNQVSAQYAHMSPSRAASSTANNHTKQTSTGGDTLSLSSHNDISRFTRGINSRGGGYNTPTTTSREYQRKNTEEKSKPQNPSGADKVNQRVPNKKAAAPDKYNPRTPNLMKTNSEGKFLDKSQKSTKTSSALKKLGNNMKKR